MTSFDDIRDNLAVLDDWEDRYRYVIELGGELEPLAADERVPANRVEGCVSQVWLVTEAKDTRDGVRLSYRGDSDALIVKGLVAILIALYSGRPASEIAEEDALPLFSELGLAEHLTSQRSNGLKAMVARIRGDAGQLAES